MKVFLFWAFLVPIIGLLAEEVIDDMVILEGTSHRFYSPLNSLTYENLSNFQFSIFFSIMFYIYKAFSRA